MGDVTVQIDIDAAPELIWAIALDPERLHEWVTIHRHLGSHDAGAARAGFKMTQTLTLRGAPFKVNWELVTCEQPELAKWEGRGPARSRAETSYRLEPHGDGTRFVYCNAFHPPLGLLGRAAQRAIAGDIPQTEARASLKRLKALCERR